MKPVAALMRIVLFAFCIPKTRAQCSKEAAETVNQFLQYDFEGYLLSSEGHEAIWKLMDKKEKPFAWPISLTRSYAVISADPQGNTCRFKVHFAIYGFISQSDSGPIFQTMPSSYNRMIAVRCKNDGCRIYLDSNEFRLTLPNPGKEAVAKWLSDLKGRQSTEKYKVSLRKFRERILSLGISGE